MRDLIESIMNKQYDSANELLESALYDIAAVKLEEAKKATSAKMSVEGSAFLGMPGSNSEKMERGVTEMDLSKEKPDYSSIEDRRGERDVNRGLKTDLGGDQKVVRSGKGNSQAIVKEEETLDEARFKIVKARVRGGKVQRRKKVSNVEGYKLHDGKLKRMSPAERRRRKLGQKRGKIKRKSKMRMAMMKRKRSLRKRSSIGL
jgi:hypothetical protein